MVCAAAVGAVDASTASTMTWRQNALHWPHVTRPSIPAFEADRPLEFSWAHLASLSARSCAGDLPVVAQFLEPSVLCWATAAQKASDARHRPGPGTAVCFAFYVVSGWCFLVGALVGSVAVSFAMLTLAASAAWTEAMPRMSEG